MKHRTIAVLALAVVPGVVFAQQDSTATRQSSADRSRDQQNQPRLGSPDSTRRGARRTRPGASTSAEVGGSIERNRARTRGSVRGSYGLSRDQTMQLQQALQSAGCDPGAVDGIVGPRTRQAVACARQRNGITSNDRNELYRSLNLDFTTEGTTGSEGNQQRVRPPADSTTDRSAETGRPPTEAQQGRGMHDSTTSTNRPRPDSTMNHGTRPDSTNRPPR